MLLVCFECFGSSVKLFVQHDFKQFVTVILLNAHKNETQALNISRLKVPMASYKSDLWFGYVYMYPGRLTFYIDIFIELLYL